MKELYPTDFKLLDFEKCKEWLPFYESNKQAVLNMSEKIVKLDENDKFYGWYKKNKLLFIISTHFLDDSMLVDNIIMMSEDGSVTDYELGILTIAKRKFVKKIIFKLPQQHESLDLKLQSKNFVYESGVGYVCYLSYRTGLVLGGGGAKGSYQIGVWNALKACDIQFELISGTSVGALNGGLILQDNLELAEKMWQGITTQQILLVPEEENSRQMSYSINQLIVNFQKLTKTAIQAKGVSTEPLNQLIQDLMSPQDIFSSEKNFFIVTTSTPNMEEKIVSLKEMTEETFSRWLLASSSFFPAMAACLIDDVYYVDGGYRNNVPKDVLINQGATELIVVDVKGPGITKATKVPSEVVEVEISSQWGLGNVLLFDGNRSSWNMRLGYLEAMKTLGKYQGIEYTYIKDDFKKKSLKMSRKFLSFLRESEFFELWFHKKTKIREWEWLQNNKIQPEFLSITLMESLAKKLEIDPAKLYSLEELSYLILKNLNKREKGYNRDNNDEMMYSVREWLSKLVKQNSPVSDVQRVYYYYNFFKNNNVKKDREAYYLLMDVSWMSGLEGLFLIFLESELA